MPTWRKDMNRFTLKVPPNEADHRIGSLKAPLILVQYGDFESLHCARAAPILDRLIDDFKPNICFIYRHFPVQNLHPHAQIAALASEAAHEQSHFWAMHHLLTENYDELSIKTIFFFAETLELDMHRFRKDLQKDELIDRVQKNLNGGIVSDVKSTPGVFLNNVLIDAPIIYSPFKRLLSESLELLEISRLSPQYQTHPL
jgi:protein-disulfide isomerase